MSRKNTKREIKVPLYDPKSQLNFIQILCDDMDFDSVKLMSLIMADWIYTFQLATSNTNPYSAFYSYLESSMQTFENLKKLKGDLLNEKSKS